MRFFNDSENGEWVALLYLGDRPSIATSEETEDNGKIS